MSSACTGRGSPDGDHCCYQNGQRCPHLREHTAGRRYACGLMVQYGTWEKVNRSPEYQPIGDHWLTVGRPFNYCELFQPEGVCCDG